MISLNQLDCQQQKPHVHVLRLALRRRRVVDHAFSEDLRHEAVDLGLAEHVVAVPEERARLGRRGVGEGVDRGGGEVGDENAARARDAARAALAAAVAAAEASRAATAATCSATWFSSRCSMGARL